jgi:cyclic beta-1,2-glucan synthetase
MNYYNYGANRQRTSEPVDGPIRAELFSVERLEQHAASLAAAQRVSPESAAGRPMSSRLADNGKVLSEAYHSIVQATRENQPIPPAAEWLLDNYHVVDEQIREIKDDLPPGFYRRLPKLVEGPLEGYPRVFGIAWAVVAHTDSALDVHKLTRFVEAYQRVQPLTIGELWAIAITLRVTLVENLRRVAEGITLRLAASRQADALADRLLDTDSKITTSALIESLEKVPWSSAFAVQLAQRLRDRDPNVTPALRWLDERLATEGISTDVIVRDELQIQSAMNVTVRNIVTSMRLISAINWPDFFETVSLVDAVMRRESRFAELDFTTRDHYRRAIESLAEQSGADEIDVAVRVAAAAKRAAKGRSASGYDSDRECDPGYYLIAEGRRAIERELGCRIPLGTAIYRSFSDAGIASYVAVVSLAAAIIVMLGLLAIAQVGVGGWTLAALALAGLVPASDLAIAITNRIITQRVGAMQLPGLEFRSGLPDVLRTMIVMPTLLTSKASIDEHIERLEVHYLANSDDNFTLALLSDWADADAESVPGDSVLLTHAANGIAGLNARYGATSSGDRFLLLHRRRVWNAGEGRWIGWERKRGKLHELNRLLRGAKDTTFVAIDGRPASAPDGVRFVITLDADTRLPISAGQRLVGKMAHPLNRPRFDVRECRVVQGHAILQPRVTPSLPMGAEGSLFQRVFSGPGGMDPYAVVVSDVYQDLYGEGSYCGKGIYDVDAFEAALQGRIPVSAVLSHDLLEGIFARAALASDIEVVEEYPSRYEVAAARQQRWVRGDWQLLPWILFRGPAAAKRRTAIPIAGRWKLLDNLRRSLSAPATLLSLLLSWFLPLPVAACWTAFILLITALPALIPAISAIAPRRVGISQRSHWRGIGRDLALGFVQCAFTLTFLAHQSWLMVDAIARTFFRLLISRRHLLEWVTTAQSSVVQGDNRSLTTQIATSGGFASAMGLAIAAAGQGAWPLAVPFGLLWILSPLVAKRASQPPPSLGHLSIAPQEARYLRLAARRTWRFFEKFVSEDENWLPPDNFQEEPEPIIAHRTSPTNIGLYLLSVVAARDFGWIGTIDAIERLEQTMATLDKLERHRGHIFNWYDTRDLRALEPKYISTVDSGNLAGHLIALSNACRQFSSGPILHPAWKTGVLDTLDLVREHARLAFGEQNARDKSYILIVSAIDNFARAFEQDATSLPGLADLLRELEEKAESLKKIVSQEAVSATHPTKRVSDLIAWAAALKSSVQSHRKDIALLAPWAVRGETMVGRHEAAVAFQTIPSIAELRAPDGLSIATSKPATAAKSEPSPADQALQQSRLAATRLHHRCTALADRASASLSAMEFGFLLDQDRQLFSIGYRSADAGLDPNFYDLLASEARLASFIAIAKGDVPAKHWFHLGRTLTPLPGGSALISWSGSMFEYLMPSLVMRAPGGSLLAETNHLIVRRQEAYGVERGVPWGISESAYAARDIERTYQYSSFGVPDLGYKRGLRENVVIAPYASALAAMIDPAASAHNLRRLADAGGRGSYGWFEALDYTPSRLPDGADVAVVRCYMAHHQAMTLLAIANALHDGEMRARFHAEPIIQAAELLLQERMPRDVAVARPPPEQVAETVAVGSLIPEIQRRYTSAYSRLPRTHLLSNGNYSAMVTAAGSGYSRWRDVAITRWREDVTRDNWGSYCFVRDVQSGDVWSAGYQPTVAEPDRYTASFTEDHAEIVRRDGAITTALTIAISPEDDAEVRRVSITNHGTRAREIELTSYSELALARQSDDMAHPAFAKLFVQTEFVPQLGALLATRRRRSDGDPMVWAAHLAIVDGASQGDLQFETDRARFIGRGQSIRNSVAIAEGWPLSNTAGAILDPIFSLRRRISVPRGATVHVSFWTLVAASRDDVLELVEKHQDEAAFERAMTLAWTQSQMQLHHLGISVNEAHLYQRLANHVLFSDSTLRPSSDLLKRGARKASTLWPHGISGDLPIVLVRIEEEDDLQLVRQLLRAHEYWQLKQLAVDLVILNERAPSYVQDLQGAVDALVRMNQSMPKIARSDVRGNVFVLRGDMISGELRDALQTAARAVVYGQRGTLADQINLARERRSGVAPPPRKDLAPVTPESPLPLPKMEFFNGLGGFVAQGREYLTVLEAGERTPAPWINVIANPSFGFQVSTDGSGYTWSVNSQQNQLTPWSNDPVSDAPGEVIYIRDEETGALWTPTPLPIREKKARYTAFHGQGYTRFEHASHGIALELLQFVPVDDAIKIARLKITNQSGRARKLSVTAFVEWALGSSQRSGKPLIVTEIDAQTGSLFAQNPWNDEFGERIAFLDMAGRQSAWTGDRTEFIGRDGALDHPAALGEGTQFSNRVGAGLDPCGALKTYVRLGPVDSVEIVIFLGQSGSRREAADLLLKYRQANLGDVLARVQEQWDQILETVQVKTPDRALDVLLNRWLLYQTLSCRVWARAGFYQASGAYGFRDQLQDVMSLCVTRPDIAREHLLRAAGRQFVEGDVQHWWLPENGRGIRTRISDDRIWLAFVTAHYVETTGDAAILNEMVPFLEAPRLQADQHESFAKPTASQSNASLFEHCAVALEDSLKTGSHGLPLMGTGDWNDGMDRVGEAGKGESVWLGWFLFSTLTSFSKIAEARGATDRSREWQEHAAQLKQALDREAWDGDWYRRAFFDDGSALGSVSNSECRIDSIAQSWAVISHAADRVRAARAMAAFDKYLVQRDQKLALLFAPPFDNPVQDPGYIKGYPPGIRENGGQYTHAATWAALAYTMLGDGDKAYELLSLLNPIYHADSPTAVQRYKVEPYSVAADVYSVPPHVGRGGWTWYTGSAAWFYRVSLERLLGFRLQGGHLLIDPCIPRGWPGFSISYRYGSSRYEIAVENPLGVCNGVLAVKIDGETMTGHRKGLIPLIDDGATHRVLIVLG